MRTAQQKVLGFHKAVGLPVAKEPRMIHWSRQALRLALITEELEELSSAFDDDDLLGVADALTDIIYVTLGAAVEMGIDIEPIFNEVHRSNMTKVIDGYLDDNGKWQKGPSYEPPKIAEILKQQEGDTQ